MTVRRRLARSNIFMFLVPLLIAGLLLLFGAGVALYILETTYLPRLGLSLEEMHITIEQYEAAFSSFETFLWIYLGAVGMALLLTIVFTNTYLTRSLFRHISQPLDVLVAGVERIQRGDLDSPIAYVEEDEFKAACDAVDLMAAKLKAALEDAPLKPAAHPDGLGRGISFKHGLTSHYVKFNLLPHNGHSPMREQIFLFDPRLTRTHAVLTGRKTPIRPQRPWKYTKYSLQSFRRLAALLLRQNSFAPDSNGFSCDFLTARRKQNDANFF